MVERESSQLGGVLDFMKNIMFSQVVNSQTSVRVIFVNSCPLVSEYLNSEYDFQAQLEPGGFQSVLKSCFSSRRLHTSYTRSDLPHSDLQKSTRETRAQRHKTACIVCPLLPAAGHTACVQHTSMQAANAAAFTSFHCQGGAAGAAAGAAICAHCFRARSRQRGLCERRTLR